MGGRGVGGSAAVGVALRSSKRGVYHLLGNPLMTPSLPPHFTSNVDRGFRQLSLGWSVPDLQQMSDAHVSENKGDGPPLISLNVCHRSRTISGSN